MHECEALLFRTSEAQLTKANLTTIQAEDIRGSRLFITNVM